MRVVGLVGVEVKLGSGALGLVALDRLRRLLGGYCQYLWSYWWSAWTGAVWRSLLSAELVTVSDRRGLSEKKKTYIKSGSM